MREVDAALRPRQRAAAPHARAGPARDAHGVAVAHQVDAAHVARQVGVGACEVGQHTLGPARGIAVQQLAALGGGLRRIVAAQRPVGGEHGRPGMRAQALVHRIDITERGAAVEHVVPRRRRAAAVDGRAFAVQVGNQPWARGAARRGLGKRRGACSTKRAATNSGKASTTCAACQRSTRRSRSFHTSSSTPSRSSRRRSATQPAAFAQRRGQLRAQPAIAFGPRSARPRARPRPRPVREAVAAGEMVQPAQADTCALPAP